MQSGCQTSGKDCAKFCAVYSLEVPGADRQFKQFFVVFDSFSLLIRFHFHSHIDPVARPFDSKSPLTEMNWHGPCNVSSRSNAMEK
jgi:hypothetical protein